ncbi:MAG: aldolase/citrate lyase family protein [Chthoniobacteraceae bacterium]
MNGEQLRAHLHSGARVYGTHIATAGNPVVTAMLANASLDFVFVCNEHMPVDRAATSALCQQFGAMGISPIVRIPYPCARHAAMALDAGAEGIVAPYVETVDEVRDLIGSVHYRPIKGRQLRGILDGSRPPNQATRAFLERFNRRQYAIIGIESVAAYENLDALIAVPGVDGVFMGPHDLSVSLEAPEQWENPALIALIEDVIRRCRAARIGVGLHLNAAVFDAAQTQQFLNLGMNWILDGADVAHASRALKQRRAELCGDHTPSPARAAKNEVNSCIVP